MADNSVSPLGHIFLTQSGDPVFVYRIDTEYNRAYFYFLGTPHIKSNMSADLLQFLRFVQ